MRGLQDAAAAPGVLEALESADAIMVCPSNPFVSIGPILATRGVREAIQRARRRGVCVAAVSPLIGGATIKGPAARMLSELGFDPTAAGVLVRLRGAGRRVSDRPGRSGAGRGGPPTSERGRWSSMR